jgi:hypothetical protein
MPLLDIGLYTVTVSRGDQSAPVEFAVHYDGDEIHGVDLVLRDAAPDVAAAWIANPHNGHRYRVVEGAGWYDCDRAAARLDAHLVTIQDAAEMQWLVDTFGDEEPYWIGLSDARVEGTWEWVTGETVEFSNWAETQPTEAAGADYAVMSWEPMSDPRGRWRVLGMQGSDWHKVRGAIVEKVPAASERVGIVLTPLRQHVAVAPGGRALVGILVRNLWEHEQAVTLSVAEAVVDDNGNVTVREGAAGLIALVDPDVLAKPLAPSEERTIRLFASLPPDADTARTAYVSVDSGGLEEPEPGAWVHVTFRVSSRIEIVPAAE